MLLGAAISMRRRSAFWDGLDSAGSGLLRCIITGNCRTSGTRFISRRPRNAGDWIMVDHGEFVRRLRAVPQNTACQREERKRVSREVTMLDRAALLGLAHHLIEARIPRFIAYELILNHKPTADSISRAEVEKLGEGIAHWGDVDSLACFIAGPAC